MRRKDHVGWRILFLDAVHHFVFLARVDVYAFQVKLERYLEVFWAVNRRSSSEQDFPAKGMRGESGRDRVYIFTASGYNPYDGAGAFGRLKMYMGDTKTGLLARLNALGSDHPVTPASGRLNSGLFSCLPTYAAVATILLLVPMQASIPFRLQLALSDTWMLVAAFLPITTIVAGFKASGVPFLAEDNRLQIWRSLAAWCLVAFALELNVVSYKTIADTLR